MISSSSLQPSSLQQKYWKFSLSVTFWKFQVFWVSVQFFFWALPPFQITARRMKKVSELEAFILSCSVKSYRLAQSFLATFSVPPSLSRGDRGFSLYCHEQGLFQKEQAYHTPRESGLPPNLKCNISRNSTYLHICGIHTKSSDPAADCSSLSRLSLLSTPMPTYGLPVFFLAAFQFVQLVKSKK